MAPEKKTVILYQLSSYSVTDAAITGEIEVWVDGTSVICVKGLLLCDSDEGRIKGMHFQTFFGGEDSMMTSSIFIIHRISGHTDDWASPRDQRAWFADISGAIIR
jgi:hypothetical protein